MTNNDPIIHSINPKENTGGLFSFFLLDAAVLNIYKLWGFSVS